MPLHCCVYSDREIYGLCELKDGKSIPVHVLQTKNQKLKWELRYEVEQVDVLWTTTKNLLPA